MNPRALARKAFYGTLHQLVARSARRDGAAGAVWPDTVTVTGFFGEGFGIGRGAELTAGALEARGFRVLRHEARPALRRRIPFSAEAPGGPDAAWILQLNPPELLMMLTLVDPRRAPLGPRIGYWAWELPKVPPFWARAAALLDQVWAISRYTAESFRSAGGVLAGRTRHAPHPLKPLGGSEPREPRRFLVQADGRSSLARKNPIGAITAFRTAFPQGGAQLVLKTQHLSDWQRAALAQAVDGAIGLEWIDGSIPQSEMDALLDSIDGVLSPHRAEGYGLALAEAALRGRAPVGTGWSGNMDFMANAPDLLLPYRLEPVSPKDEAYGRYAGLGVVWAEPDIDAAADILRRLVERPGAAADGVETVRRSLAALEAGWDEIRPGAPIKAAFSEAVEQRNMF